MDKNRFLIDLSESKRTDFGRVDFADQPEEQRVFSAIWRLASEVNNGGFAQYFQNDRGKTAGFAAAALKRIGANQRAGIVESAVSSVCGESVPSDARAWETLIEGMTNETSEILEGLDSEFYKYPDDLTGCFLSSYANIRRSSGRWGPSSSSRR